MPIADVIRFVDELIRELDVDYVVIGGIAVSAQAEPRSTKDIDLILLIKPSDVDSLLEAIESKGLKISKKAEVAKKLKDGRPAKIIWDERFSFDLRIAIYSIDENAIDAAEEVDLERYDVTLRVATPEDLIVYKLARYDDTDRKDIKSLIALNKYLNWEYIKEQATILNQEAPGTRIMKSLREVMGKQRLNPHGPG